VGYQVQFRATARDHFDALDAPVRKRVAAAIDKLADEPRPPGATFIVGMPGCRRIRVADYRVLYTLDNDAGEVWIEDVRHRSKAYPRRR